MIPSYSSMKTNWLDSHGKNLTQKYKDSSVCVAGGISDLILLFKSYHFFACHVSSIGLGTHWVNKYCASGRIYCISDLMNVHRER